MRGHRLNRFLACLTSNNRRCFVNPPAPFRMNWINCFSTWKYGLLSIDLPVWRVIRCFPPICPICLACINLSKTPNKGEKSDDGALTVLPESLTNPNLFPHRKFISKLIPALCNVIRDTMLQWATDPKSCWGTSGFHTLKHSLFFS